jgi:hypothetical protein
MENNHTGSIHWSFWVIAVLALIWNLMGVINYVMQMNPDMLATMPQHVQDMVEYRPSWATGAFAIAVFGGALGSLLLLLKKRIAQPVFIVSLLGTIVAVLYGVLVTVDFTPFTILLTMLAPIGVAVFMIWYTRKSKARGWI